MRLIWNTIADKYHCHNEEYLIYRACPICKADNSKTILTIDNFQFFSDDVTSKQVNIHQKQCKKCGTIYMNPCYSNKGFEILFAEAGQSYGSTSARPTEQVDWLNQHNLLQDNSRLLDIGCGTGNFLASLPKSIRKVGVDIDAPSIQIGKENHQEIEFICSSFEDLEYKEEIDTITMFHVLEHLPKPLETLQRLYKLSNTNTQLVIEVPIIENGLTNDINGFFSAQHLTHFSRMSFKNVLALSGWGVIDWLEQKDYNGCRVLAKKQSKTQDIEIGSEEFLNTYNYLSYWYHSVANIEKKILDITSKRCIIWGGGMHLEFLYQMTSLFNKGIEFIVVDSDKNKQHKSWRGINIYPPSILEDFTENIPLIISSYGGQNSISVAATSLGIKANNIIKLYDNLRVY
ncbi:MAG: class I SAM-dependent methyltransferase [Sulfurospirillaceae bacterium]|nr:class I SAM-dependent methyltransferase [Sulfurospirillaceae bacterium]